MKKTYSFRLSEDAIKALDALSGVYGSRTGVIEYWAYRSIHGENRGGREPAAKKIDVGEYLGSLPVGWAVKEDRGKKWVVDGEGQVQKIFVEGRDY